MMPSLTKAIQSQVGELQELQDYYQNKSATLDLEGRNALIEEINIKLQLLVSLYLKTLRAL